MLLWDLVNAHRDEVEPPTYARVGDSIVAEGLGDAKAISTSFETTQDTGPAITEQVGRVLTLFHI